MCDGKQKDEKYIENRARVRQRRSVVEREIAIGGEEGEEKEEEEKEEEERKEEKG